MKKFLILLGVLVGVLFLFRVWEEVKYSDIKPIDRYGGIRLVWEVNAQEFICSLAGYYYHANEDVNKALELASVRQESTGKNYIDLFVEEYRKLDDETPLATIFSSGELSESITSQHADSQVISVLKEELDGAVSNSFNILRSRVDRFGVSSPDIQHLESGRILMELPGVKDPERVRKLLQRSGNLEFWETYDFGEIVENLLAVNDYLESIGEEQIQPAGVSGPVIGYAYGKSIDRLNEYFKEPQVKRLLPRDLLFKWSDKPLSDHEQIFQLYAIKRIGRGMTPLLDSDVIVDAVASLTKSQWGNFQVVTITMNKEGAVLWENITENNIGRSIAMVVDDAVFSAPTVRDKISGGRVQISGDYTKEEAEDLAIILKSGKMPSSIRIVQEEIVSPVSIE